MFSFIYKLNVNLNLKCKGVREEVWLRFKLWKGAGGFGAYTDGAMAHNRTIGDPAPFLPCLVSEDLNFVKIKGI